MGIVQVTDKHGKQYLEIFNNLGALMTLNPYEYMGKKKPGNFTYYGYKARGSPCWKVARKDNDGNWQYAYADDGWTAAWADPTVLIYGDPPDDDPVC